MIRQERPEVRGHADRSHSGPAAAVRNAERLVEVQVADVGAHVGRPAEAHLGVHVGAVHIDLTAVGVHDLADLPDRPLENAGGGRVGDHQRAERALVLGRLGAQVREIDRAARIRLDRHHGQPGHDGTGGVGAVGGGRDQTGGAVGFTPRAVIGADHEQPGELPLRSRVGLQRDVREAGDLGEHVLELPEQRAIAGRLLARSEGVQPVELPPRERHHLGRRVELHGARAQRDHRRGE